MSPWFPDNTVLCNFGAVRRLDLLENLLGGRGRWTQAVAYEAGRSARYIPDLSAITDSGWLGIPIEVSSGHSERIERIRIASFGGDRNKPLEHRGEAETCFVIREVLRDREAVWITDDEAAYDFGRRQGILTLDTRDLVERMVADGLLVLSEAFDLLVAMADADRSPRRLPGSARELC